MNRIAAALLLLAASAVVAADPPDGGGKQEAAQSGWIALFDGTGLDAWQDRDGGPAKWRIEDGALSGRDGSGDIWTKQRFSNFVLELEFRTTGNSGVFVRTDNPKDNVQTGIEVQIDNPGTPGRHSVGAIYDLVAPSENVARKDEWNRLKVTCDGPKITVEMNGRRIAEMDLDRWTEAGKNPDGSPNKFRTALKDFKREGHIGFQDHGHRVWYRNVRIRPLD